MHKNILRIDNWSIKNLIKSEKEASLGFMGFTLSYIFVGAP